jgi:hypothetical protein
MTAVRLRDMMNLVIGVIIIIGPWFNGDAAATNGAIRLRLVAAAICAVSLWIVVHQHSSVAEWFNAALGAAMISAPCWRGGIDPERVTFALAGAIVAAFAASCALQISRESRFDRAWSRIIHLWEIS